MDLGERKVHLPPQFTPLLIVREKEPNSALRRGVNFLRKIPLHPKIPLKYSRNPQFPHKPVLIGSKSTKSRRSQAAFSERIVVNLPASGFCSTIIQVSSLAHAKKRENDLSGERLRGICYGLGEGGFGADFGGFG